MDKDTFVFYRDWIEALEDFDNDFKQRIIMAIINYALYGQVPTDTSVLYSPFAIIRKQIDRDRAKYNIKRERLRENAKKSRKKANGNESEQEQADDEDCYQKKTKETKSNQLQANASNCSQMLTKENICNQTDTTESNCSQIGSVNVNVNVNDNVYVNDVSKETIIFSEPKGSVSTDIAVDSQKNQNEIDFNEIAREFNLSMLGKSIPQIEKMTDKRKSAVRARIKEYGREAITTAIHNASESDFLNGDNNRGWKADFDWIFRPNNFPKVLEGNYNYARQYNTNNAASGHNSEAVSATEQRNDDFMQHILNKIGNAPSADNQALWQRDAIP